MYANKTTTKTHCFRNTLREPLQGEQGMVLVIALMIMVILSLLASFATTVSNTERLIATNDEIFINNFYAAEAVCIEAGANLEAIPNTNLQTSATWGTGNTYPWLESAKSPADPNPDIADPDGNGADPGTNLAYQNRWPYAAAPSVTPANTALNAAPNDIVPPGSAPPDRIQYAAQDLGVAAGGSVTVGQPQTHAYALYGMYDVNRGAGKTYHGKLIVSMGYKKIVYP